MMDFIFKNWQKKLSDFESSVKKDLAEIRTAMTSGSSSRLRRLSSVMLTRQAYTSTVQALR